MISVEDFLAQRSCVLPEHTSESLLKENAEQHTIADDQAYDENEESLSAVRPHSSSGFRYAAAENPYDEEACKEAAFRLLDAAAQSTGKLREKLLQRGYAASVIDVVIQRLEELQLVDDEAYAQAVIRSCERRLMGMRAAVMEMTRKGIDRSLAQRVANEANAQGLFDEAAWELGRKIAQKTAHMDSQVRLRRFWSAGGRKGHNPQVLREIAQELFSTS